MIKNISYESSVLINFLKINRLDLIGKCSHTFYITSHVREEITAFFPGQRMRLEEAITQGILQMANIETANELYMFSELNKNGQLGVGECSAIAIACSRGYLLAIDDMQAIKKASAYITSDRILRTQDLVLLMIQEGVLDLDEADQMIELWASKHRFKMKIKSFRELISL